MKNSPVRSRLSFMALAAPLLCLVMSACIGGGGDATVPPVTLSVDFNQGGNGWVGGSADYSDTTAPPDVITAASSLPAPLAGLGYRLSGTNRSDDLFIYAKQQVGGLDANVTYSYSFSVNFATRVPQACIGVGGSPGDGVWLVAGAASTEPQSLRGSDAHYRLNWDRGNQSHGGTQAAVLGNISNSRTDCSSSSWVWETKTLNQGTSLTVTPGSDGKVWILLGIDSGFEAYSEVYLLSATATLTPQGR